VEHNFTDSAEPVNAFDIFLNKNLMLLFSTGKIIQILQLADK